MLRINKLKVQRSFHVGDRWVFLKIYCKTKNQNAILEQVGKLIGKFTKDKKIQSWFFIRYADPRYHLRLRFLLPESQQTNLISEVFIGLRQLLDNEIISGIELDTYTRELERYGEQSIEKIEDAFFHNSQMVLSLLKRKSFAGNLFG
ncbi:MAG: hypothetical protein EOO07_35195 [Chitinophagaceae bacterium]|nr:MAG: hypothetical protein EOO07_35195 [Chitinophagaceae bacterium]